MPTISSHARAAYLALRAGVAFAFIYPPIAALTGDPYSWIGYFPGFTRGYVDELVMLHTFGVIEVVIALWILSGYKIFIPSLVATAMLLGIVVFNLSQFEILFRDLSIAAVTLALALMNLPARPPLAKQGSEV
jgi:uncharacterized membrane protein YphA (DoxX/SURF4 family)